MKEKETLENKNASPKADDGFCQVKQIVRAIWRQRRRLPFISHPDVLKFQLFGIAITQIGIEIYLGYYQLRMNIWGDIGTAP